MSELTADRLRELLHYDPETGAFTWLRQRGKGKIKPGTPAGGICKRFGYVFIRADDGLYRAHRLAWLYMTGAWPLESIDHIDRDKANNRWSNLRAATPAENGQNCRLRRDNKTGHTGVFWDEKRQLYLASIVKDKRTHWLGRYPTLEEALSVRLRAKESLHTFNPAQ